MNVYESKSTFFSTSNFVMYDVHMQSLLIDHSLEEIMSGKKNKIKKIVKLYYHWLHC